MNAFIRKSKNPIFIAAFILLAALCVGMLTLGTAADEKAVNEISAITLSKNKSSLNFEISLTKEYAKENKSSSVHLFEFLPYQSTADINSMEPVKSAKVGEKITLKIPFLNGNISRLYSKFVLAERAADGTYNIITKAKYIDNITALSENPEAYPEKSSKKGLQLQIFSDAQQLGVAHTVINVPINEYMLGENSDAAQSFVYNGQTFYINRTKLALLDHRVKTYTDAGINVYFNIILTPPQAEAHPNILGLYFDGAMEGASLYALNTRNETSMKMFQAFVDYMAAHYTRADHAYGFVPAMILGFEVNSSGIWNNAGQTDLTNYVYSYCSAFRVAYTAMASHYSEGRVYISLGNNFTAKTSEPSTAAVAAYDYPAKDFLELFAAVIKSSGDIPWGLSINPYPSDPALVEYWNDTYAENNLETPFVTMKNIGALTRYMHEENMLYDSKVRSIIIGEFGIPGDSASDDEMTMQAAAYALAYYTAAQNEDIDAFIYHRQVDHSEEMQNFGLWTSKEGSVSEPSAKKPIYNVFSLIDTENSENVTAFVRHTVGSGVFDMFMPENVKYKQFNKRTVIPSVSAHSTDFERGYRQHTLLDLTTGRLQNFYPSDSADYVELRPVENGSKTVLYSKISGVPTEYKGISNTSLREGALENAHYITLRVMAAAPNEADTMSLMLRLQSDGDAENSTVVYEGEVNVKPNTWTDVSFKIKDFSQKTDGNVDSIKLWVRTANSNPPEGEYGIWLETVTVHTKGGMSVIGWIFTVLLILVLIVLLGYGVLYIRAQYIRKKRREAAQLRRREALRQQQMMQTRTVTRTQYTVPPNDDNQM